MSPTAASKLTVQRALIFRIVHKSNIEWILDNGLHCRNSGVVDPNFIGIGNSALIGKRHHRQVPVAPNGTLSDYIPFYFTPFSPMLLNIKTGWGGITRHPNSDIAILVSNLNTLAANGASFVFTDRHAYLKTACYYQTLADLPNVDFDLLRSRQFAPDSDDPGKMERYQAEALVHQHLPVSSLDGILCYDQATEHWLNQCAQQRMLRMKIKSNPNWYF